MILLPAPRMWILALTDATPHLEGPAEPATRNAERQHHLGEQADECAPPDAHNASNAPGSMGFTQ
jgi:hypothetical protein